MVTPHVASSATELELGRNSMELATIAMARPKNGGVLPRFIAAAPVVFWLRRKKPVMVERRGEMPQKRIAVRVSGFSENFREKLTDLGSNQQNAYAMAEAVTAPRISLIYMRLKVLR